MFGSQTIPVYCHMENFGCGDGGWTPVMKIDGTKVGITPVLTILAYIEINLSVFIFRELSTTVPISGATEIHTTLQGGRLDSIHKRPSYQLTGAHPSPRFVLE